MDGSNETRGKQKLDLITHRCLTKSCDTLGVLDLTFERLTSAVCLNWLDLEKRMESRFIGIVTLPDGFRLTSVSTAALRAPGETFIADLSSRLVAWIKSSST